MTTIFTKLISKATGISERQVAGTIGLLEEGCTIPFISRYRKEVTGALNDEVLRNISDSLNMEKAEHLKRMNAFGKI